MKRPRVAELVAKAAAGLGVKAVMEPDFGFVGELIFPGGKRHVFLDSNLNVNGAGAEKIARDKGYTHYFLAAMGINTPRSLTFFSDRLAERLEPGKRRSLAEAIDFAGAAGYPVFVKPIDLLEGKLVFKAHDESELRRYATRILAKAEVAVIEAFCPGNDYRVVALDGEIISAYRRLPLSVIGNGRDNIDALLQREKDSLSARGRPDHEVNPADDRIDASLARQGLTRGHVPAEGECVPLLDNANISTGGRAVDLTESIHSSFAALAIAATQAVGLRFSGVDILCDDLTAPASGQRWSVIEVNGEPDLDNYAAVGDEQELRLERMYRRIIAHVGKKLGAW